MSKRIAMLIGLALAAVPGMAAGQQVGASFRIAARPLQPELVASAEAGALELDARVPSGWAVSVGGGGGARRPARVLSPRDQEAAVSAALAEPARSVAADGSVTLTFVPL